MERQPNALAAAHNATEAHAQAVLNLRAARSAARHSKTAFEAFDAIQAIEAAEHAEVHARNARDAATVAFATAMREREVWAGATVR